MTRLIIFDFDGTLGDTRANIVLTLQQTLETLGYPPVDEGAIIATIGLPLEESFARLISGLSEEEKERCARTYREIFEKNRKILIPKLFPHVYETLGSLHAQGITMSVASSRRAISLNAFLQEMGIAPFFSFVLGADNVSKAKPDPEPVLQTLRATGYRADEALMVGDMPVDILMGARAGARTVGFTYGNSSREDLKAAGADYVFDRFSQLLSVLD